MHLTVLPAPSSAASPPAWSPALLIAKDAPLGFEWLDHPLKVDWADHRECHIGGDFLLIY
ncbi:type II toxin-antitoxin system mRNA interferase toxin, RelE/StbE family [Thiorhodovibrio winogradskyi]|uniref:type II toxin-antitoxin system mRNA interferase toxin, RelE/StbE family n=1 Tax=Thiorhodovibrio winogradskyi TaxID=77007 RepID=UPI002E2CFF3F|nr:type II toxin-antitoxin system mRNA interferase toxin, RelE/StbE family [Thiorhodovibrio winogradskyi]